MENSPVPVSNDSLMPHQESHNGDSQIIQPAYEEGRGSPSMAGRPSVIPQAPTAEVRDVISISKSDLGVIAEPKSKKWPVVVLVAAGLIGLFILYEYMVYRSLINQG